MGKTKRSSRMMGNAADAAESARVAATMSGTRAEEYARRMWLTAVVALLSAVSS